MRPRLLLALLLPVALHATEPATPLVYTGPAEVAPTADGGLPPVVGVQNIQVFRANRSAPAHAAAAHGEVTLAKAQLDFAVKDRAHAMWPPGLTLRLRFTAHDLPPAYFRWVLGSGAGKRLSS